MERFSENSIYAMGNPYILEETEIELAQIIMKGEKSPKKNAKKGKEYTDEDDKQYSEYITHLIATADTDFIQYILRPMDVTFSKRGWMDFRLGGLIPRLHKCLGFDVKKFPLKKEYIADVSKIIYFIHMIEHTPVVLRLQKKEREYKNSKRSKQFFNLIDYLSKPSMENTSPSLFSKEDAKEERCKRFNGRITDFIKSELEKEMRLRPSSLRELNDIRNTFLNISDTWNKLLNKVHNAIDTNRAFDFEQMTCVLEPIIFSMFRIPTYTELQKDYGLQSPAPAPDLYPYQASPIATLYFKILQLEYFGEVWDRVLINTIDIDSNYEVPQELIERMKLYKDPLFDIDIAKCDEEVNRKRIVTYIKENAKSIAKYVFSASESIQKRPDEIQRRAERVPILMKCCSDAGRIVKPSDKISKLLIISCLQATLDKKCNIEYDFYDYEYHLITKHKPTFNMNINVTSERPRFAAQSLYWARQVEEHWYANLGKYQQRCKLRTLENCLYMVLAQIFGYRTRCQNISEMRDMSEEYYSKLPKTLAFAEES